jgi:hypothetical protein
MKKGEMEAGCSTHGSYKNTLVRNLLEDQDIQDDNIDVAQGCEIVGRIYLKQDKD